QKLADYFKLRWDMRMANRGVASIGLLFLVIGAIPGPDGSMDLTSILFGFLFLGESLWHSWNPKAERLLVEGVVFGLIGLWHVGVATYNALHNEPLVFFAVFGMFITLGAMRNLIQFPRARALFQQGFTEEQLKQMEELCDHVRTAKPDATT